MEYFRVVNWDRFQQYKDRNPPWIKLHNSVFEDYEFSCLQDASKLLLILIWLLASKTGNKIPCDAEWIKCKVGVQGVVNLKPLIANGFIEVLQNDSGVLAPCLQDACLETEKRREETYKKETETETETEAFLLSSPELKNGINYKKEAKAILIFLNKKVGSSFREVDSNLDPIVVRLKSGIAPEQMIQVIAMKKREWIGNPDTKKWLNPITLFGRKKFETYLGQLLTKEQINAVS